MKCAKCGLENPEDAKFCSSCGNKLIELRCCTNPECENYNRHVIPLGSWFCPTCGQKIEISGLPYNQIHPEMHLISRACFFDKYDTCPTALDCILFDLDPEYIEDPNETDSKFIFMVRKGKLGIAKFYMERNFFGKYKATCSTILSCIYDSIEKKDDGFVCVKGGETIYFDIFGHKLK